MIPNLIPCAEHLLSLFVSPMSAGFPGLHPTFQTEMNNKCKTLYIYNQQSEYIFAFVVFTLTMTYRWSKVPILWHGEWRHTKLWCKQMPSIGYGFNPRSISLLNIGIIDDHGLMTCSMLQYITNYVSLNPSEEICIQYQKLNGNFMREFPILVSAILHPHAWW